MIESIPASPPTNEANRLDLTQYPALREVLERAHNLLGSWVYEIKVAPLFHPDDEAALRDAEYALRYLLGGEQEIVKIHRGPYERVNAPDAPQP